MTAPFPTAAPEAAELYLARGFMPIPLDGPRTKKVTRDGWPDERYAAAEAAAFAGRNVGLLLGAPSNGLVDVDLDCPEAIRAAAVLLPRTDLASGRAGAIRSHWWYACDPLPAKSLKLFDPTRDAGHPDGHVLLELRAGEGNALMTVVPPSTHADTGESILWHSFGEPKRIGAADLEKAVRKVAAASLLGRHWPTGGRHDAALALAGGLLRAWDGDAERVEAVVGAVCAAAADEELSDRLAAVRDTAEKLAAGGNVTGWPKLAALVGDAVVTRVREWLDIRATPPAAAGAAESPAPDWPDPPHEAAFHGLAGDIVRALDPDTEADPVALLAQLLVYFGNRIGRSAHFAVEADRHFANEFAVLVGRSSKARKGTSKGRVQRLFQDAEDRLRDPDAVPDADAPSWVGDRVQSGLSSGEGAIWAVRDPVVKQERVKERGQAARYESVVADPGEPDKRLLVVEPEFANVLKQTERQGNTLSAVLRQAWESGHLRTLTKNSPARATDAHVSVIGHITAEELARYLTATESANGFANRFLWFAVQRSKELPEGGRGIPDAVWTALVDRLAAAIRFAETVGQVRRDEPARELWRRVYGPLSAGRPGLAGCLVGRSEAHVTRLSLLYALLDGCDAVGVGHLLSALALWDFAERSVAFIFGDSLGDPVADDVLRLIRRAGTAGVTRTDIQGYLGRHVPSDRLNRSLGLLLTNRKAHPVKVETAGRSAERWFPGPPPA